MQTLFNQRWNGAYPPPAVECYEPEQFEDNTDYRQDAEDYNPAAVVAYVVSGLLMVILALAIFGAVTVWRALF